MKYLLFFFLLVSINCFGQQDCDTICDHRWSPWVFLTLPPIVQCMKCGCEQVQPDWEEYWGMEEDNFLDSVSTVSLIDGDDIFVSGDEQTITIWSGDEQTIDFDNNTGLLIESPPCDHIFVEIKREIKPGDPEGIDSWEYGVACICIKCFKKSICHQ